MKNHFNQKDWEEQIRECLCSEDTNDGGTYGNLIDWSNFRSMYEEELLDTIIGSDFPWGESISLNEFNALIYEIFEDNEDVIQYYVVDIHDMNKIDFKAFTDAVFDFYGVPNGIAYESSGELKDEFCFYRDDEIYQVKKYINEPLIYSEYCDTLRNLQDKIKLSSDELDVKSFLLTSFILSESFFKSEFFNHYKRKIKSSKDWDDFEKNFRGNKIYELVNEYNKDFKGDNAVSLKSWIKLRNELAHNIGKPVIDRDGDKIYFFEKPNSTKPVSESIENLFKAQIDFANKLNGNSKMYEY